MSYAWEAMDEAAAKEAGDTTALICVECRAESSTDARGRRAYLTIDDEAAVFCPSARRGSSACRGTVPGGRQMFDP